MFWRGHVDVAGASVEAGADPAAGVGAAGAAVDKKLQQTVKIQTKLEKFAKSYKKLQKAAKKYVRDLNASANYEQDQKIMKT